jgi:mannitol-1-/sugar-/sorbitol-6-phosphatase
LGALHARAIVFDKDGVLVDTMAIIRAAWAAWAERRGLSADEVLASIHMTAYELLARFAPAADPAAEIGWISAHQATFEQSIIPFPGARELLTTLAPDRWAIVTSGRRSAVTRHLGMAGLPQPRVLVAAEDTPRGKPDPAGYLLAATRLRVAAGECVAVEDSPAGIRAARDAGMFVVGVTNTHPAAELTEANAIIASLDAMDLVLD